MIYTSTLPTFGMVSTWRCAYGQRNGRLEWYISFGPTDASHTVTFPVSLPAGAEVNRAWLTMGFTTPISGSAYRRVNGISIPPGGEVELEGIRAETTSFEAVFSFRANGAVYQDIDLHEGRLSITDPTLHVDYTVGGGSGGDADEDVIIVSGDREGVPQLPRLFGPDFREVARLTPISLRLSTKLHPLSTAEMRLPIDGVEIKPRAFVELFSPNGSAGVFRVKETSGVYGYGGEQNVYLEHAFGTLSDSLALGTQAMSGTVATVISTLLEGQTDPLWVLGDCDVPDDYEIVYEYSYQNLLQAIMLLTDTLPGDYAWEFDTTQLPFVMHLRLMPETDACECRMHRNLTTAQITMDTSNMCTRVYPFGAGDGTDRVTLTNLIGTQHMDSDNASVWGVISRTFTSPDIFDALTLRDVAQRYLNNHDHPLVSVQIKATELYKLTGEPLDRFRLGRRCRLALPSVGVQLDERVIEVEWPDVYGDPNDVDVVLANRIRDPSDEIAQLMQEATNSKLLGGTVETIEESARAGSISPVSPYEQTFSISGYGNVLNVKTSYRCITSSGESVNCNITVDGNVVETSESQSNVVDLTRYLATDDNGVPVVGDHKVQLSPDTPNTTISEVDNTITIKQIAKR